MVIVVAGEKDQSLTGQALGNQAQQTIGRVDRLADGTEEKIEKVAEEDQLIDALQSRRQPLEEELLAQQVPVPSRRRSECRR
jgi:hypothetical protein